MQIFKNASMQFHCIIVQRCQTEVWPVIKSCFSITGSIFHTVIINRLFLSHFLMFIYRLDQPERTDNTVFVAVFSATLIFATLVFHFFFYTFMRWRRRKLFENIQDDGI